MLRLHLEDSKQAFIATAFSCKWCCASPANLPSNSGQVYLQLSRYSLRAVKGCLVVLFEDPLLLSPFELLGGGSMRCRPGSPAAKKKT